MSDAGVALLLAKPLAPNDNRKNQIYLGGGFHALGLFPVGQLQAETSPKGRETLKAPLSYWWIRSDGSLTQAPNAQLILYPDYPEVRLSGLLRGSIGAPVSLVSSREVGRILFLGVTNDRRVIGAIAGEESNLAREYALLENLEASGVFTKLPLQKGQPTSRDVLLAELRRIHLSGWIAGKALNADGSIRPCNSSNCVGYTLEAELGVARNGYSEPDFMGWEVKAGQANNALALIASKAMTLLTPEPNLGIYRSDGAGEFVRRFGYADRRGREDRLNFGGVFRVGCRHDLTGLTLHLTGYDRAQSEIVVANGAVELRADDGTLAAGWTFSKLATHWNRKHAQAVYVPALCNASDGRHYRYGQFVRLGEGTDFLKFLEALVDGIVYYDPAIKIESASTDAPRLKRRSQFRVKSGQLPALYASMTEVELPV